MDSPSVVALHLSLLTGLIPIPLRSIYDLSVSYAPSITASVTFLFFETSITGPDRTSELCTSTVVTSGIDKTFFVCGEIVSG
jgi:hypothetical protein